MNICFDAFPISHLPNTGLYSYSYQLIDNIFKIYPQPHYNLITNNSLLKLPWKNSKGISIDYIDINRKERDYSVLANYLDSNNIKLYHSLNNGFSIPIEKNCKYVVTIHDLLPLSESELVDKKYYDKFMNDTPRALESADKVIAVSEFLREELITRCNIPEDKIEVIYPVISKDFKPIPKEESKEFLKRHYNITDNYLLYAGSIHPRKNLPLLLATFKEITKREENIKLIIIGSISGKREAYYLKLRSYARKLGIDDRISFLGSVVHRNMPYFYNGALCFLNFSIYDGFPLTSVEAIACNIPVICNDFLSFKEILGTNCIYTNTKNPKEIAEQITQIVHEKPKKEITRHFREIIGEQSTKSMEKIVRIYESVIYD